MVVKIKKAKKGQQRQQGKRKRYVVKMPIGNAVLGTVWSILRVCIPSLCWFPTKWKRCCFLGSASCGNLKGVLTCVTFIYLFFFFSPSLCPWIGTSKQQKVKRWDEAETFHIPAGGERGSTAPGSSNYRGSGTSSGAGGPCFVSDIPGKNLCWSESDQSLYLCFLVLFFVWKLMLELRWRGKHFVNLGKLTNICP